MNSRGFLDVVSPERFYGWAIIENQTITPEITIHLDTQELCKVSASLHRPDVAALERHPTGLCGFEATEFDQAVYDQATVVRAFIAQTGVELANSPFYLRHKMSDFEVDFEPLVFVHLPKTAGTSFRYAIESVVGAEHVLKDYERESSETSALIQESIYSSRSSLLVPQIIQRNIKFLTGHFKTSRYLPVLDTQVRWCTFLRHPVQRVISEYHHFLRNYDCTESLESFCRKPFFRNRQSQLLQGLELEDFFFVGITELYDESIAEFNRLTGLNIPCLRENTFRAKLSEQYQVDNELLNLITENNIDDFRLYERVRCASRSWRRTEAD
ncbi:MAG: sulfotransferase family protein [Pegethrix bostrychoides GSE-TBD4-15B]|jgi:hypothetical protein|uniref:Sulfotransferase family protein n=1 Tax=Pegethrix bostrychoides GSE-TBD4-15B TaxID=2839662 RepID=A0A951PD21_9CYAN|nr:sulfotransferase family protein [Pegethrix bostrychoides GSE-TBD4-15B]